MYSTGYTAKLEVEDLHIDEFAKIYLKNHFGDAYNEWEYCDFSKKHIEEKIQDIELQIEKMQKFTDVEVHNYNTDKFNKLKEDCQNSIKKEISHRKRWLILYEEINNWYPPVLNLGECHDFGEIFRRSMLKHLDSVKDNSLDYYYTKLSLLKSKDYYFEDLEYLKKNLYDNKKELEKIEKRIFDTNNTINVIKESIKKYYEKIQSNDR